MTCGHWITQSLPKMPLAQWRKSTIYASTTQNISRNFTDGPKKNEFFFFSLIFKIGKSYFQPTNLLQLKNQNKPRTETMNVTKPDEPRPDETSVPEPVMMNNKHQKPLRIELKPPILVHNKQSIPTTTNVKPEIF